MLSENAIKTLKTYDTAGTAPVFDLAQPKALLDATALQQGLRLLSYSFWRGSLGVGETNRSRDSRDSKGSEYLPSHRKRRSSLRGGICQTVFMATFGS